jgi:hypothetical protein
VQGERIAREQRIVAAVEPSEFDPEVAANASMTSRSKPAIE